MKKLINIFLVLLTVLAFSSCARVNFGLDNEKNIQFNHAGGFASPERGLDIIEQQATTKVKINLYNKLNNAITDNNTEEIKKTLNLIKKIEGNEINGDYRNLKIQNIARGYSVTITSEPFCGLTLNYGEKSKYARHIPVGIYVLKYQEYKGGGHGYTNKKCNIPISVNRTTPITIYKK